MHRYSFLLVVVALPASLPTSATALPVGTAFSYQGRLNRNGQATTGVYDLQFQLYTAATGGVPGETLVVPDVVVENGLFTVTLDFTTLINNPNAHWLAIGIRVGNVGGFTVLDPRQPLTPAPFAVNLALPYSAFYDSSLPLFTLTQTGSGTALAALAQGTGTGIQANILNSANPNPALAGTTNGSGQALFALNSGVGRGAQVQVTNAANPFAALEATTAGTGSAGDFRITNPANSQAALYASTGGSGTAIEATNFNATGGAGKFTLPNSNTSQTVLHAETSGFGAAVYGKSLKGRAGFFQNTNALNLAETLRAENNGVGAAISGTGSGTGAGVRGGSSGSGPAVLAVAGAASGKGLEIGGGGFHVTGAGVNTNTTAFIHKVTAGNSIAGGFYSAIDNSVTNGRPGAILLAMFNSQYSDLNVTEVPVSVEYFNNKWHLRDLTFDSELEVGMAFSVFVINP